MKMIAMISWQRYVLDVPEADVGRVAAALLTAQGVTDEGYGKGRYFIRQGAPDLEVMVVPDDMIREPVAKPPEPELEVPMIEPAPLQPPAPVEELDGEPQF